MVARESDDDRARGGLARFLAPAAFLVAATALVLIVHNSLQAEPASEPQRTASPPARTAAETERGGSDGNTTTTRRGRQAKKRFYRVRSGDTLESIAARFDTTATELLELNPGIDPLALSPGQRIRVR